MKYIITVEGETFEIEVGHGRQVWVNRRLYTVDFQGVDGLPEYSLLVDHRSYEAHVEETKGDKCQMVVSGRSYRTHLQQGQNRPRKGAARSHPLPPSPSAGGTDGEQGEVCAPLPGLVAAMPVVVGQHVEHGEVIVVLESMKMNLELCAPWSGVVRALHGTLGAEVTQGEVLAVIGPHE